MQNEKRVMILGQEGYIGTALTFYLKEKGYIVEGIDNDLRVRNVGSIGSKSLTEKKKAGAKKISTFNFQGLKQILKNFQPDAIVHLAEQPSAPFSMRSVKGAVDTQKNNILGTMNVLWAIKEVCPDAHLVKLGTEGEYPDWLWDGKHIPEGNRMEVYSKKKNGSDTIFKVKHPVTKEQAELLRDEIEEARREKRDIVIGPNIEVIQPDVFTEWEIPTPRSFGSIYHSTKFYESHLIDYLCRVWGLTATDVNQGVVYGHCNGTRLDYDSYFGTVVNRFAVQAVAGMPLTVYGRGDQTRGFIALQNSIEAIELLIANPADKGEFRVIHQTTMEYSVNKIAQMIQDITGCEIEHIENPRAEMESNSFTFDNSTLIDLGLRVIDMPDVLPDLIETVKENKENIKEEVIKPTTTWQN